jgi:hypothetical protein
MNLSFFVLDRRRDSGVSDLVQLADQWVKIYQDGSDADSCICFACERRFVLPEPPPRFHAAIVCFETGEAVIGGICDTCEKRGRDHCAVGIAAHAGLLGLKSGDFVWPHEIAAPGRA